MLPPYIIQIQYPKVLYNKIKCDKQTVHIYFVKHLLNIYFGQSKCPVYNAGTVFSAFLK